MTWPPAVRREIPVNVTVPAVDPATAHAMASSSGCTTAKVKVAEPGQQLGYTGRRQDVVHRDVPQRAARHAGMLRLVRVLHHRDAAAAPDLGQPSGAVAERAREDHAHHVRTAGAGGRARAGRLTRPRRYPVRTNYRNWTCHETSTHSS